MKQLYALDLDEMRWQKWAEEHHFPPFVAKQILEWLFTKGIVESDAFSNLSLKVRKQLKHDFHWSLPLVDTAIASTDGSEKLLLKASDGKLTECVIMPSENRVTLCVSSQVGCRMGCHFCQTGKMGFGRNLSRGEILAQILLANHRLKERKVTNVVFMGMGEPLDNYHEVVEACRIMIDPRYLGLSKHRVTISTSGLVPEIEMLGKDLPVSLAISLHAADDELRTSMMPINQQYPLSTLKKALLHYPIQTRHGITFEYVMIHDKNDSLQDAKKLVYFLHGLKAKVNLIPMNPFPGSPLSASHQEKIHLFQKYLSDRSIPAPIRYSRGQDISAACGQLAAKRQEELHLAPQTVAKFRRQEERKTLQS